MNYRKVTRTWTTKSGITKTKTYTYKGAGKSRRGKTLVSKSGKINKKNLDQFRNEIDASTEYNDAEKRALKADLNIIIKQRVKSGKKLTTTGFLGELSNDAITRMLVNAGYSPEEAARDLGVDVSELLDTKNWNNDIFMFGTLAYQFQYSYTGSLFTQI